MSLRDCPFCKIARKEIPSNIVYEDDDFVAFLDIRPLNPGHTLVIPRKHYRWVWDVPEVGRYYEIVARIARALQRTMGTEWVASDVAGMGVHHAHIHLIPRFSGDGHGEFPVAGNAKDVSQSKMKTIVAGIKNALG